MKVSVITCTHNPDLTLFSRVQEGLRCQTLDVAQWEWLIVDNASKVALSSQLDLKWHPNARIVREEKVGLTNARIRGITEAKGELLVFVDDDNILAGDYLEAAIRIGESHPTLGAWGGSCMGEFEVVPPEWFHISILGIREVKEDRWSRSTHDLVDCPIGAGMVIRPHVAHTYAKSCLENPIRSTLDRAGSSLMGAGDFDMAFTACDMGMDRGVFKDLSLIHYMPAKRLSRAYFIRMKEGLACSLVLLKAIREGKPPYYKRPLKKRIVQFFRRLGLSAIQREILIAKDRGKEKAMQILYPNV